MASRKKPQTPPGLKGAAYEIWLAGLGAFNLAGEEGGRIFKSLVDRGRDQSETNKEWMANLSERAQGLKEDAKEALGKVTTPIEEGLSAAMQRLGVPTRDEIVTLTHRVEALTRHVTRAAGQAKPKTAAKPKPRPKAKARPRTRAAEQTTAGA